MYKSSNKIFGLKKVFFIFTGILISFLIIEFSLHIGGLLFQWQVKRGEITKRLNRVNKASLSILCVGDSYTFGAGAKSGYSYPEQLQKLIDAENMNYTFYNLGVPGMNSSTVLLELPKWIELYKPQIIVLLIGANDNWNYQNSNYYLFQKNRRFYISLQSFLIKFRTYKLYKILAMNISKLISRQSKRPLDSVSVKKVDPKPEIEEKIKLAYQYFHQERDFNKVKKILKNIIEKDPYNYRAYYLLGSIYRDTQEFNLAQDNLKKAITINPYDIETHKALFSVYRQFNKKELARKELDIILELSPEDELFEKFQKFGIPYSENERIFAPQLNHNLTGIIKLTKARQIYLILQNYPDNHPIYAQEAIKYIVQKYYLPLVDNAIIFSKLSRKDYFASDDSHPNENGYFIMAKNIFEAIKKINDQISR